MQTEIQRQVEMETEKFTVKYCWLQQHTAELRDAGDLL